MTSMSPQTAERVGSLAGSASYDVMIVDRMLPSFDGLSLVKAIRANGVKTPVLVPTTMSGVGDRVEGLEAGGDDYLENPLLSLNRWCGSTPWCVDRH